MPLQSCLSTKQRSNNSPHSTTHSIKATQLAKRRLALSLPAIRCRRRRRINVSPLVLASGHAHRELAGVESHSQSTTTTTPTAQPEQSACAEIICAAWEKSVGNSKYYAVLGGGGGGGWFRASKHEFAFACERAPGNCLLAKRCAPKLILPADCGNGLDLWRD